MTPVSLSARFGDGEALERALSDLRRLGALRCPEAERTAWNGAATMHVTLRPEDASMARAIVRRAGGVIL